MCLLCRSDHKIREVATYESVSEMTCGFAKENEESDSRDLAKTIIARITYQGIVRYSRRPIRSLAVILATVQMTNPVVTCSGIGIGIHRDGERKCQMSTEGSWQTLARASLGNPWDSQGQISITSIA